MTAAGVLHGVASASKSLLRHHAAARNGLMRAAAARGRSLILCYHQIAPVDDAERAVDPVSPERFFEQMRALKDVAEVLPLHALLSRRSSARPAAAVTFDDDDPSHVRYALPVLRELGIPATFFLSGRTLHGLGPYWWTLVERSVADIGLAATCDRLGLRASSLKELVRLCRAGGGAPELAVRDTPPVMEAREIRMLVEAGMTVGFHTVEHPALPLLDDDRLERALSDGRAALESVAGARVDLLAYPYGRADARVAAAARRAGFRAAFITGERATAPHDDLHLLPRWQPGSAAVDDFLATAALRLARAAAPRL